MSWQSCGGRWWPVVSRSVDLGALGSSCIRIGFATILRPASGSLPNAGCVETSRAGWATSRSTSANAIRHGSTTGPPGPAGPGGPGGPGRGGAGAGTDFETDSDSPDGSGICGSRVASSPGPFDGWDLEVRPCLGRDADATTLDCGQSALGVAGARGEAARGGGYVPVGDLDAQ